MSWRQPADEAAVDRPLRSSSAPRRPSNSAMRLIREASSRRFLREPSIRVRQSAEEQVEQRQSDLAYSWPVVILDLIWNAGFISASLLVVAFSLHEQPAAPLRLWLFGYSAQCCVHMVCVWSEYQRRCELQRVRGSSRRSDQDSEDEDSGEEGRRRRRNSAIVSGRESPAQQEFSGSLQEALLQQQQSREGGVAQEQTGVEDGEESDEEELGDGSVARHVESINTMFSFVWWVVGLGWLLSTFDDTFEDSPLLSWLCMIFLAFDVFFVIFCTALACVVGLAVCCCLPCIIAVLYAVGDRDGASPEAIAALPRLKFRKSPVEEPGLALEAQEQGSPARDDKMSGGFIVPVDGEGNAQDRPVPPEDAECCICLGTYDDGALLRELPCGHHFDQSCIDKWLRTKPTCPLCKYDIIRKSRPGAPAASRSTASPGRIVSPSSTDANVQGAQPSSSIVSVIRASARGFFAGNNSQP